jgi:predicted nucleic-acid-binding protein
VSKFQGSLDTNTLLRLLLRDVPKQHASVKNLVESCTSQLAIADVVFFEVAFVLVRNYGFSREQVSEAIQDIMSLEQINCNRRLFDKALQLYVAHPALGFEDCALSVYAELNNATPLYTFDKKLANQTKTSQLVA